MSSTCDVRLRVDAVSLALALARFHHGLCDATSSDDDHVITPPLL